MSENALAPSKHIQEGEPTFNAKRKADLFSIFFTIFRLSGEKTENKLAN